MTFDVILLLFLFRFVLQDSCPFSVDYSHNFAFNGDFELPDTKGGAILNAVLPGWIADKMEVGKGSIFNSEWGSSQVIQMAVHKNANYTKVFTLQEGKYFLSFQYACRKKRPLATSGLDVYWNQNLTFSVLGTEIGDYHIHTQTFILTAFKGDNSLTLMGTGDNSDGSGMTVDNVQFYSIDDGKREQINSTNGTITCECKYGYFDDGLNFSCISCSNFSQGCEDCQYDILNSTFNLSLLTCTDCPDGQYSQGSVCAGCQIIMDKCLNCSIDGVQCFECQQNYFPTWNMSNISSMICLYCPVDNCINCSSLTECEDCNETNNYFLNSSTMLCQECTLNGCLLCNSFIQCLICNQTDGYFLDNNTNICDPCNLAQCLDCLSLTECLVCNQTANYFFNISTKICEPCDIFQCLNCLSFTQCATCNHTAGYFLNETTLLCDFCSLQGCITCSSLLICMQCNIDLGYDFSPDDVSLCQKCNESCVCQGYNFPWNGSSCSSTCGDGWIVQDEECDDGNDDSYDGCSKICKVQEQFECENQPSNCSFVGNLSTQFLLAQRNGCNSLIIELAIQPQLPFLKELELNDIVGINHENISVTYVDYRENNLKIKASYSGDISEGQFQIFFNKSTFAELNSLKVTYNPLLPPFSFSKNQCETLEQLKGYLLFVEITSYVIFFISCFFSCKIIGLELFGVLQLAYWTLIVQQFFTIYSYPLAKFKSFNGFSFQLFEEHTQVSQMLRQMEVHSLFFNNFNAMFFVFIVWICFALIVYLASKITLSKYFLKVSKHLLKEGFITFFLFFSFSISFSVGIHSVYASSSSDSYNINTIFLYFCLILLLIPMIILLCKKKNIGEFKTKFKKDFPSQSYISLTFLYRISLGLYISLEIDYEEGTIIALGFCLLFMLYNIANLPFRNVFHNYRSNIIHISFFIILMASNYYKSMKSTTLLPQKARIYSPSILVLASIGVCVVISFLNLIYEIFKNIKKHMKKETKKQLNPKQQTRQTIRPDYIIHDN